MPVQSLDAAKYATDLYRGSAPPSPSQNEPWMEVDAPVDMQRPCGASSVKYSLVVPTPPEQSLDAYSLKLAKPPLFGGGALTQVPEAFASHTLVPAHCESVVQQQPRARSVTPPVNGLEEHAVVWQAPDSHR